MTWDNYFMGIAEAVAARSKDPNTKVGAILVRDKQVISTGYNGMVSGAPEIWTRPEKYDWVCHAEANAISFAARHGNATRDTTLYTTCVPCLSCLKSAIQAGVVRIVYRGNETHQFAAEYEKVVKLCDWANVKIEQGEKV